VVKPVALALHLDDLGEGEEAIEDRRGRTERVNDFETLAVGI
jgi:hypothetical protein